MLDTSYWKFLVFLFGSGCSEILFYFVSFHACLRIACDPRCFTQVLCAHEIRLLSCMTQILYIVINFFFTWYSSYLRDACWTFLLWWGFCNLVNFYSIYYTYIFDKITYCVFQLYWSIIDINVARYLKFISWWFYICIHCGKAPSI